MQAFANPVRGRVKCRLTKEELIQTIRLAISNGREAIYIYDAHVQAMNDVMAQKVISDIRDVEKIHVGKLMTLLRILDPKEPAQYAYGETKVINMAGRLGI